MFKIGDNVRIKAGPTPSVMYHGLSADIEDEDGEGEKRLLRVYIPSLDEMLWISANNVESRVLPEKIKLGLGDRVKIVARSDNAYPDMLGQEGEITEWVPISLAPDTWGEERFEVRLDNSGIWWFNLKDLELISPSSSALPTYTQLAEEVLRKAEREGEEGYKYAVDFIVHLLSNAHR